MLAGAPDGTAAELGGGVAAWGAAEGACTKAGACQPGSEFECYKYKYILTVVRTVRSKLSL